MIIFSCAWLSSSAPKKAVRDLPVHHNYTMIVHQGPFYQNGPVVWHPFYIPEAPSKTTTRRTTTRRRTTTTKAPSLNHQIYAGTCLNLGQSRTSPNGCFKLIFQTDGNLVVYPTSRMYAGGQLWHAGTHNRGAVKACMQNGKKNLKINFNFCV